MSESEKSGIGSFLADFVSRVQTLGEDKAKFEQQQIVETPQGTFLLKDGKLTVPKPDTIASTSLEGLLDYHQDIGLGKDGLFLASPKSVKLIRSRAATSFFGEILTFADAIPVTADMSFIGKWMDQEEAVIKIKTSFAYDDVAKDLLSILGTIVLEESITTEDDGVSQKLVGRAGINLSKKLVLGTVTLKPYETFAEVQDRIPGRLYNVRVKKEDAKAYISLHASKDPSIDLAISQAIKYYLEAGLVSRGLDEAKARSMVLI